MTGSGRKRSEIKERKKARQEARVERRQGRQEARAERRQGRQEARAGRGEGGEGRREGGEGRRRRSPEVARQELLDAAERVFIEFAPDQVGLKEIGREAGVSHALVTHYFGTYQGLIEAVLRRRLVALREATVARLREAGVLSRPEELLGLLFRVFDDPVHLRLVKWLVSTERPSAMHLLALQEQGLQIVAHQVASALTANPSRELIERVELALMTSVAAAMGYAVSKYALAGAAGKQVGVKLDEAIHTTLAGMLRTYIAAQL